MRWKGRRGSANVEDRRGMGGLAAGGGIGGVVLVLLVLLMGGDPSELMEGGGAPSDRPPTAAEDSAARFVAVVLADTEEVWQELFRTSLEGAYREPTLVLFTGSTRSACGQGRAAMGPFYCPLDERVYLDLGFFEELQRGLGAPGEFARAYVVAHEVGHHVQTLLGISEQVHRERQRLPAAEGNALSVRQELQADCFAGVWANRAHARWEILETGDVEAGMGAAAAVGDDRLRRAGQGEVVPETFTHGTSEQRVRWFRRGLESGDPQACDTFGGGPL
jgi:uncharacterized protein